MAALARPLGLFARARFETSRALGGPLLSWPSGLLASAACAIPLLAHRGAEYIAVTVPAAPWDTVALHTLPPLAMLAVAAAAWRSIPALPDAHRRMSSNHALAVAAGLLLGALAAVANLISVLASQGDGSVASSHAVQPATLALAVHVALLAPIAEEAAFRGLIYRHLRRAAKPLVAAAISATIFALMHAGFGQSMWALFLGLIVAFAYEKTGSLVTPILIHALFNAVPVGVAVARAKPSDLGPLWLVLAGIALAFTLAAHGAAIAQDQRT